MSTDFCASVLCLHPLATLLVTLCYCQVGPPLAFRTTKILCDTDSISCWKHSTEILVFIGMIASHSWAISKGRAVYVSLFKIGRIHVFMLFMSKSDPTTRMSQQKSIRTILSNHLLSNFVNPFEVHQVPDDS